MTFTSILCFPEVLLSQPRTKYQVQLGSDVSVCYVFSFSFPSEGKLTFAPCFTRFPADPSTNWRDYKAIVSLTLLLMTDSWLLLRYGAAAIHQHAVGSFDVKCWNRGSAGFI